MNKANAINIKTETKSKNAITNSQDAATKITMRHLYLRVSATYNNSIFKIKLIMLITIIAKDASL